MSHGLDFLLDDRDVRPGVKFKDADLMGTPVRITVGERTLKQGLVEIKIRSDKDSSLIPVAQAAEAARSKVKELYDQIK